MTSPEPTEDRRRNRLALSLDLGPDAFDGFGTCDFGGCNEPATATRNDLLGFVGVPLPVCTAHLTAKDEPSVRQWYWGFCGQRHYCDTAELVDDGGVG